MKPKWQKLAGLAQEICTLWFQFFGAVFASKGYPLKNIFIKGFREVQNGHVHLMTLVYTPNDVISCEQELTFTRTTRSEPMLVFVNNFVMI